LQAWLAVGSRLEFDVAIDLKRTTAALLHGKATCPESGKS
jgi:hypothetical protein